MDLGAFAEEVLHAVAGICGDAIVETHTQAAAVLDALLRRPGTDHREVAAVFGVSFEQLERCKNGGDDNSKNEVYENLCRLDTVYTWNVVIQRINQAAHWREEFRDIANSGDSSDEEDADNETLTSSIPATPSPEQEENVGPAQGEQLASNQTRQRARALLAKQLDAPEALKQRLVQRLDDDIFEEQPGDRDYRHCVRAVASNFRRNTMLAAGFSCGRVPPQWIVLCDAEALAPRLQQLHRRLLRKESLRDALQDDVTAECRRKAQEAARGTNLAPPPPDL
mmetsp:Transcript_75910/g.146712  ORF Transcript_75910/g.146712 Transcript_75910/m.146712 type:complete len:281 (+) Transcript_75910:49-891(+)